MARGDRERQISRLYLDILAGRNVDAVPSLEPSKADYHPYWDTRAVSRIDDCVDTYVDVTRRSTRAPLLATEVDMALPNLKRFKCF